MAFRELVDNLRFNVFNVNPKYSRIHCDFIKVGGVGHLFIIVNILKKKKEKHSRCYDVKTLHVVPTLLGLIWLQINFPNPISIIFN